MRVRGLMKTPVTTVDPDDSLHIADGIMSIGGIRHLPVVRGSALGGIVTQRDILRTHATTAGADARTPLAALSVGDVMTRQLVTTSDLLRAIVGPYRLLANRPGATPPATSGFGTGS